MLSFGNQTVNVHRSSVSPWLIVCQFETEFEKKNKLTGLHLVLTIRY